MTSSCRTLSASGFAALLLANIGTAANSTVAAASVRFRIMLFISSPSNQSDERDSRAGTTLTLFYTFVLRCLGAFQGSHRVDPRPAQRAHRVDRGHDIKKVDVPERLAMYDVAAHHRSGVPGEISHHVHRPGNRTGVLSADVHTG